MKWPVICLVTILWLSGKPITHLDTLTAEHESSRPVVMLSASVSDAAVGFLGAWVRWWAVVGDYGACPGRVTLCRWRSTSSRKERPTRRGDTGSGWQEGSPSGCRS